MLGFKELWVLTVFAGTVVADDRCLGHGCDDANDGTDDSALLQVRQSSSVNELVKCAENFACGAVSAKVGESMQTGDWGSIKGLGGMIGSNYVCQMQTAELNKYLDGQGVTDSKNEVQKAQACVKNAQAHLVVSCANAHLNKFLIPYHKYHLSAGESLILKHNATYLKECGTAYAAQKHNKTLQAKLYTACGYPKLAKALTDPPPSSGGAGDKLISEACQLGGMLLVQFVNILKTKYSAYKMAKLEDDQADKDIAEEEGEDQDAIDDIDDEIKADVADDDADLDKSEEGEGANDGDDAADEIGEDDVADLDE